MKTLTFLKFFAACTPAQDQNRIRTTASPQTNLQSYHYMCRAIYDRILEFQSIQDRLHEESVAEVWSPFLSTIFYDDDVPVLVFKLKIVF